MSDHADSDPDHFGDGWGKKWEDQCRQDWEDESNMDDMQREKERDAQRLWLSFQNSATAIAQLYKGEVHILHRLPFNSANHLFVGVTEVGLSSIKLPTSSTRVNTRLEFLLTRLMLS